MQCNRQCPLYPESDIDCALETKRRPLADPTLTLLGCPLWANSGASAKFQSITEVKLRRDILLCCSGEERIYDVFKDGETYWVRAGDICARRLRSDQALP